MNTYNILNQPFRKYFGILFVILIISNKIFSQTNLYSKLNQEAKGQNIRITFTKGKNFNHPLMAFWVTSTDGQYIQTLYVSESIAKGIYQHGKAKEGKWLPGEHLHPAALPFWAFSRNIKEDNGIFLPTPQNPIADAYTGATPQSNFVIETKLDNILKGKAIVYFEINQPFDFNDYWHNTKYPDNQEYKNSGQPSIVFGVIVDFDNPEPEYYLNPLGHGHPAGENGKLFTDLSTLTTALNIVGKIKIEIY
jgi:hypothetical protein